MSSIEKLDYRILLINVISLLFIFDIWFVKPIPQDLQYHQFADQLTLLGIPNFWNVASNLPFILVALYGFWKISTSNSIKFGSLYFYQAWTALVGIFLTGFGSAYYHVNPNNSTLFWDRLPLTLSFMAFFSIVIAKYLSHRAAKILFVPLLAIGVISIAYWDYTERLGHGDLRLYALVQFLPIIVIPLILILYSNKSRMTLHLWCTLVFYGLAKLLEYFDKTIFDILSVMGGHAFKHVVAAIAVIFLINAITISENH